MEYPSDSCFDVRGFMVCPKGQLSDCVIVYSKNESGILFADLCMGCSVYSSMGLGVLCFWEKVSSRLYAYKRNYRCFCRFFFCWSHTKQYWRTVWASVYNEKTGNPR